MAAYDFLIPDIQKLILYPDKMDYKHPGYHQACEHAEEMGVHFYGHRPSRLLNRVRPREEDAIKQYRLESYEPTTKSTAGKALAILKKIFNPKLYAIKPAEGEGGKELFEYATINYPKFNSVVNFLAEYGLKKTMSDPNGVFLVEPYELPYTENEHGDRMIDVTKQIKPVVNCYPSHSIYLITEEFILIHLKSHKGENGIEVHYFKYVDKKVIQEFSVYTSNRKEFVFDDISVYNHDCESLPFWFLGGEYISISEWAKKHDEDKKHDEPGFIFESYAYPAVPFWNKAICAESDLDGAFIGHLHPQKWEVAEECEFVERTDNGTYACDGGYIFDSFKGKKYKCPSCGGTGHKSVKSPHETYQISRDKLQDASGGTLAQPPAGYIDVPTEATKMLDERVDKLLEKGLSALAMDIVNKIGENQSGVSKAYDRTELFDFLGQIRDLFFDKHLVNIFYYFAKFMFYGKSDEEIAKIEPTIIKPNDFDIFTTQELTDQLKVSKDSNLNPGYLQTKQIEIQNKEFQSNPEVLQFLNLTVKLDPLAEIGRADVDLMILSKTVTQQTAIIHDNIREFVSRALSEDNKFKDKEYLEQMEVLTGYADEIIKANEVKLDEEMQNMIPPNEEDMGNNGMDNRMKEQMEDESE